MRRSADPRTKVKRWTVVSKEIVKCREVERRHEQLHESRDHGDTGDGVPLLRTRGRRSASSSSNALLDVAAITSRTSATCIATSRTPSPVALSH